MRSTISRSLAAAVLGTGLVFGVVACSNDDAKDSADEAGNALGEAADKAGDAIGDAAGDATDAAGNAVGEATDAAGNAVGEATGAVGDAVDGMGRIGDKEVPAGIAAKYQAAGGADRFGELAEVTEEKGVKVAIFPTARIYDTPDHGAVVVQGEILRHWMEAGGAESELGLPIRDEQQIGNGWISYFENGSMKWSDEGQGFTETIQMGDQPQD